MNTIKYDQSANHPSSQWQKKVRNDATPSSSSGHVMWLNGAQKRMISSIEYIIQDPDLAAAASTFATLWPTVRHRHWQTSGRPTTTNGTYDDSFNAMMTMMAALTQLYSRPSVHLSIYRDHYCVRMNNRQNIRKIITPFSYCSEWPLRYFENCWMVTNSLGFLTVRLGWYGNLCPVHDI